MDFGPVGMVLLKVGGIIAAVRAVTWAIEKIRQFFTKNGPV